MGVQRTHTAPVQCKRLLSNDSDAEDVEQYSQKGQTQEDALGEQEEDIWTLGRQISRQITEELDISSLTRQISRNMTDDLNLSTGNFMRELREQHWSTWPSMGPFEGEATETMDVPPPEAACLDTACSVQQQPMETNAGMCAQLHMLRQSEFPGGAPASSVAYGELPPTGMHHSMPMLLPIGAHIAMMGVAGSAVLPPKWASKNVDASAGHENVPKFCPYCGNKVQTFFKFCQFCGEGLRR